MANPVTRIAPSGPVASIPQSIFKKVAFADFLVPANSTVLFNTNMDGADPDTDTVLATIDSAASLPNGLVAGASQITAGVVFISVANVTAGGIQTGAFGANFTLFKNKVL